MPGHEPIHTLPDAHLATFNTADQLYLRDEWPALQARVSPTTGFVHSGGLHAAVAGMISAPFALDAFTELGNRITADGAGGTVAINYTAMSATADDVAWVIATAATPDIAGNFHRVGSSNLMVNVIDTTRPTLPADSVWLMRVTITSSSLAVVQDLRVPSSYARFRVLDIADPLYGADGSGQSNASPALQAAVDASYQLHAPVFISPALVGYRLDDTVLITDRVGRLTIQGVGSHPPVGAQPLLIGGPVGGSVLIGNTGVGRAALDFCGSVDLTLTGFTISSLSPLAATPSQVGILYGSSTTANGPVVWNNYGGGGLCLQDVAILLPMHTNSICFYAPGGQGLNTLSHLTAYGDYCLVIAGDDPLSFPSQVTTYATGLYSTGWSITGGIFAGSGDFAAVRLHKATNIHMDEIYAALFTTGEGPPPMPFALHLGEIYSVVINISTDLFPQMVLMEEVIDALTLRGNLYTASAQFLRATGCLLGRFQGATLVTDSDFLLSPIVPPDTPLMTLPLYTTAGAATLLQMRNCRFLYHSVTTSVPLYADTTGGYDRPFWNLRFDGDVNAGITLTTLVDGVAAPDNKKRIFLNGTLFGSA